ncbi:MAG: hypothetical protein II820_03145 [Ruminiclostridium sp.]|nr:hypothetical protein [Ruminiclostridium sp.]
MSDETKEIIEETAKEEPKKKKLLSENTVEVLVAVFLGITALLTAWATWIGSLHGGNQSTNYTTSNNLASEGNSEYNAGMQLYLSDLMAWNTMMEYSFDQILANAEGNEIEADLIGQKLSTYAEQNCSSILLNAINNMDEDMSSPYEVEGVISEYFVTANELLEESRQYLEQGKIDNAHGDAYNLVNVIYSVVLFMLGIVGVFKRIPNRTVVLIIAVIGLVIATVYMLTIPMPTGFDIMSFFSGQ